MQDILILVAVLALWLWLGRRFFPGGSGGC